MTRCAANCLTVGISTFDAPSGVGAAQYVLQQHGFDHDEATNEAKQLYESLYADYDKRYYCWRRHEERKTNEE